MSAQPQDGYCVSTGMPSHEYTHPKVVAIKVTSPHRKTKIHQTVPRDPGRKTGGARASSPSPKR